MTGYESKKAMAQAKLDSMEREALKLALDLATMHHTDDGYAELRSKVRQFAKEALAQPAQEPVAWAVVGDGKFGKYKLGQVFVDYEATHIYWENRGYELVPVYTTPPQRKPLTDEEIWALHDGYLNPVEFARAVLAKSKEKNT